MGISVWQILIVVVLLVLLFGRGKISDLMGDVAKGIKSFKRGMKDDPEEIAKVEDAGAPAAATVDTTAVRSEASEPAKQ